jgi:hypothetical protein
MKSFQIHRELLIEMQRQIRRQTIIRASSLLKEKSQTRSDAKRTMIDSQIDEIAINLCFQKFGIRRPRQRTELMRLFTSIQHNERLERLMPKNERGQYSATLRKLYTNAEKALGSETELILLTALFPTVRTALVREVQKTMKTERT